MSAFEPFGFLPADILLPGKDTDMKKWSAVACDQYTSEPAYWNRAYEFAKGSPSTLDLFLPEAFLKDGQTADEAERIRKNMESYLASDLFDLYRDVFVYVERTQRNGKVRRGLVGAVDLEKYEFVPGSDALIRATEGTVADRLPPRIKIRREAPIELPHIMLLCDDPEKTVIEPLANATDRLYKLYDFDLMENSGHLRGWLVDGKEKDALAHAFARLMSPAVQQAKYGADGAAPMLFAVGDGNHSLAAAKKCWEQIRETLPEGELASHPARYALCELVNVHDDSLEFEAIHRVVFGCEPQKVLAAVKVSFPGAYEGCGDGQQFRFVSASGEVTVTIPEPSNKLTVGSVQSFLDDYITAMDAKIDYIHGDNVVRDLCREENVCGFLLPAMSKSELFPAVMHDGVLPRKTFSMGEACDKRFYLECRKITK